MFYSVEMNSGQQLANLLACSFYSVQVSFSAGARNLLCLCSSVSRLLCWN